MFMQQQTTNRKHNHFFIIKAAAEITPNKKDVKQSVVPLPMHKIYLSILYFIRRITVL